MPHLIAKEPFRYASRQLAAGESFEASESDAFVLTRAGKAESKQDEKPPQTIGETESGDDLPGPGSSRGRRGRRYSRRDMRAEGATDE